MFVTEKSRHAINSIVYLGTRESVFPCSLEELSEYQSIKPTYLIQVFIVLRDIGVIEAIRGPGGGYRLKKDAKDIKVSDIIFALESFRATKCGSSDSNQKACREDGKRCYAHELWHTLEKIVNCYFSSITIEDIIHGKKLDYSIIMKGINNVK